MSDDRYQKIAVACSNELVEIISNYFIEHNTGGVVAQDDKTTSRTILTAYIDPAKSKPISREEIEQYIDSIKGNFADSTYEIVALDFIEAEDWLAEWKKSFVPLHVTNKIVIRPTWEIYELQPGEIEIIIDPKMAFGTGHHETTAQCLRGLEMLNVMGKRVLDYGCGSGILAIAAYKLGASEVIGCDNDPEAIECAIENVRLNKAKIELVESANYIASPPCDIIAANLTIDQIITSFNELDNSLKENGRIIFSGILMSDKERLLDFLFDKPYVINDELAGEEWISYLATKESPDGD